MNVFEFNRVIYNKNINIHFYLYCLKRDLRLIRFLFINLYFFIISFLFKSKKDIYEIKKYNYIKYVKDLEIVVKNFSNTVKLKDYLLLDGDMVIERTPKILLKNIFDTTNIKVIGYEFDKEYNVKLELFDREVLKVKRCNSIFLRCKCHYYDIKSKNVFVVHNNKISFFSSRKKINNKLLNVIVCFILSIIITVFSFIYANYEIQYNFLVSYFEIKLFLLNFIPIFLAMLLLLFLTKRLHLSWLLCSGVVIILGIANQTKLIYRDDVVKFEDLTLLKEALIMGQKYAIFIKWYSVIIVLFIVGVFFILKKYMNKINMNFKKYVLSIVLSMVLIGLIFNNIMFNDEIYNSVGDKSLINIWIFTRQSQIRGLVYPFIYSTKEFINSKPDGYDEKIVKDELSKYEYRNIPNDKKVNIVAIMLESYNDFSKWSEIDFNEDIYEKFHRIERESISGNLITTIYGGGTVDTERKFLTGYNDLFNFRSYTNSYVWYFKEQGYNVDALHPIYGSFYNRASINVNLGFDNYYNYENTFSTLGDDYYRDYKFFEVIKEKYEEKVKSGIPYFSFSVTYQNHGPYKANDYDGKEYFFDNKGYGKEDYNMINQYLSGIKSTNDELEKLINYFDKQDSPTIVILFGDHNPSLDGAYSDLGINMELDNLDGFLNYYATPYVIHANNKAKDMFGKSFVGKGNDISPSFLMNELFNYCGFDGNQYMQYTSEFKKDIDVISLYYYKEDSSYVRKSDSKYSKLVDRYNWVNYYVQTHYNYNNLKDKR